MASKTLINLLFGLSKGFLTLLFPTVYLPGDSIWINISWNFLPLYLLHTNFFSIIWDLSVSFIFHFILKCLGTQISSSPSVLSMIKTAHCFSVWKYWCLQWNSPWGASSSKKIQWLLVIQKPTECTFADYIPQDGCKEASKELGSTESP